VLIMSTYFLSSIDQKVALCNVINVTDNKMFQGISSVIQPIRNSPRLANGRFNAANGFVFEYFKYMMFWT